MKDNILLVFLILSLSYAACNKDDDSIITDTPENSGGKQEKIKDTIDNSFQFKVAKMEITTDGGQTVDGKEKADYRKCKITVTDFSGNENYSGTGKIRGRGNSSWLWYDKKPYRIKLDEKSKILGLKSNKDWVLLANYRDATDLMNVFVFELGKALNMPFTNNSRFVEVTLNGDYSGLYQLTEQIEVAKSRVDINEKNGILLSLDSDDGPELSPSATDNFWSEVYQMPCCVKNPDKPSKTQVDSVKQEFAMLEEIIFNNDYEELCEVMNVDEFINYLLIQEFIYNVEVAAPRSIYLYKDINKKWGAGPLWDFDAGYDFDWGSMYTGHNFFMSYKELVLGTDPRYHEGGYSYVPEFFTDMFFNKDFVQHVQNNWLDMADLIPQVWETTKKYEISDALNRDLKRWPIDKTPSKETDKMGTWISNRINYMNTVVGGY